MGISFRKSVKIGGVRVNFSKSGIGSSTGIRGLRVGVNSRGSSYVSAGTNIMHYRKTFSSKEETKNSCSDSSSETSTTDIESSLFVVGLFCSVIGIIYPILFIVPGIMLMSYLIYRIRLSVVKKIESDFTTKINAAIDTNDFAALEKIIESMQNKTINDACTFHVYENTYRHLLEKALEDNVISDTENKVIELYKEKISSAKLDIINSNVIDEIVAKIINDGEVTDQENEYLNKVITVLKINDIKQKEINSIIVETNKIAFLRKNGLKVIDLNDEFVKGKECYYKESVEILKVRKLKGATYYENDSTSDLYIYKDFIDIVGAGHKKIKIKDIINVELKDGIIAITVLNRQKPICLKSEEPSLVIAIIGEIKEKFVNIATA